MPRREEDEKTVEIEVSRVINETDKALLVEIDSTGEEIWIPKSQITDDSEVYSLKSGPGTMQITRWIAEQKKLIGLLLLLGLGLTGCPGLKNDMEKCKEGCLPYAVHSYDGYGTCVCSQNKIADACQTQVEAPKKP